MYRRLFRWAIVAVLLLPPVTASAWHNAGHEAVAAIAWRDMSPPTRQRVVELLRQHPDFGTEWQPGMAASGVDAGEYLFMRAAIWPDDVRSPAHPSHFFHMGAWHFLDQPYIPSGQPERKLPASDQNALNTLKLTMTTLHGPKASPVARSMALCWLFHLVGDVHQPLHAATLLSDDYPNGDRGGNDFHIQRTQGSDNLHSFWDGLLDNHTSFPQVDDLAADLALRHKRADLSEISAHPMFADWLQESFQAAIENTYNFSPDPTNPTQRITLQPGTTKENAKPLPDGYAQNALKIAEKRVALAGYRLADQLQASLRPMQ